MRVLVIGGTRFIGPYVVRGLAAEGHDVSIFHRGEHKADLPASVNVIVSPQANMPIRAIPDNLRRLEPEVVLHMIAMGEEDMLAAVDAFAGIARRLIVPSSGDVYKAYGIFKRIEDGPPVPTPLTEDSNLRTVRYPYRQEDTPPDALEYHYDKILVEAAAGSRPDLPATILRLPKVYGPEDNTELMTVYGFRDHPSWRWTHGHVENVAHAITLAITDDRATGRIYNVGEQSTPTIGERLEQLPRRADVPLLSADLNFAQDIAYDTSRIRLELGYQEVIEEAGAMRAVVEQSDGRLPDISDQTS